MARVKLTEYDAKRLLFPSLNQVFTGYSAGVATTAKELATHFPQSNLVVKVDQGIKKRGKRGLVKVNVTPGEAVEAIKQWVADGWQHFLVEPVFEHAPEAEHYLALERMRDGWQVSYSETGGIEVESSWNSVKRSVLKRNSRLQVEEGSAAAERTDLNVKLEGVSLLELVSPLISALEAHHIVFLEMNPIIVRKGSIIPLDMAAEIDDTALGLSSISSLNIVSVGARHASPVEIAIAKLDAATPASLKFRLINPQGSIWMLLSGGGASLVLADEVADQGMGGDLANYGEYSGAPTDDDVYSYTKLILAAMLQAVSRKPRALVIAAGVANFTDVAKTFKGIIRAMGEVKSELVKFKVKVFVRRGGPNEAKGLKMMEEFLSSASIPNLIHTHKTPITQVISEVKQYLGAPSPKGSVLKRNSRLQVEKGSSADERTVPTGTKI